MSEGYDPTTDRVYLYGSLVVQGLMFIALMVIAVLRFVATKQNTKLNTIKNIYYTNKNKALSSEVEVVPEV
ncbi:MAG: hypothetical protein VZR33_04010 [Methanosphaera sp.]|nr:hypothetical protein [Methanosphaera sp.]